MILDVTECDGRNIDADSLLGAQYFDVPRRNFHHQSAIWANPRLFAAIHAYRFAAGAVNRERVPILRPQKRPDPVDHNSLPLIRKSIRFKFAAHHFAGNAHNGSNSNARSCYDPLGRVIGQQSRGTFPFDEERLNRPSQWRCPARFGLRRQALNTKPAKRGKILFDCG